MKTNAVLIVGVGGQGTLLASRILGEVLLSAGQDVKVSEVHGMSQRGGSVVTHVRWGDDVASPIADKGEADFILAFEQLEAARWLPFLKIGGVLIANTQRIAPMPVITGAAVYPAGIFEAFQAEHVDCVCLDAQTLALRAGSARAVNTVLLGALSKRLPFPRTAWDDALTRCVKPAFRSLNQNAFAFGADA
jgi:indolepyruvate ferredoxin oxidoreductase beta subunit